VSEVEATTRIDMKTAADAGYAYATVYGAIEANDIDELIPAKAEPIRSGVALRRFRYGCVLVPANARSAAGGGTTASAQFVPIRGIGKNDIAPRPNVKQ
jgi:hypothetical protein